MRASRTWRTRDSVLAEGVAQFKVLAERDGHSHLLDEHEVSLIADAMLTAIEKGCVS
jgi:hypothetical protein